MGTPKPRILTLWVLQENLADPDLESQKAKMAEPPTHKSHLFLKREN